MDNEEKSRIERLRDSLYSRDGIIKNNQDPIEIGPDTPDVPERWQTKNELDSMITDYRGKNKKNSFLMKLFGIAVAFFVIALLIAGFVFLRGANVISSKNVDITISGPVSIAGGEELALDIIIANNNNTDLEDANLILEYPDGTRSASNIQNPITRVREPLGLITSGQNVRKTETAVLFGEKDEIKKINVSLEYRVRGSSALFAKEKTYEIAIQSSPVIVSVARPSEVNPGRDFQFTVTVASNSSTVIGNLLLRVEYPFGYVFKESLPRAVFDDNVWAIGDLKPGEKRTIVITGAQEGQNEEERTFRFRLGVRSEQDEKQIGADFAVAQETVKISRPHLSLDVSLTGENQSDPSISSGKVVRGVISWFNNLPTQITNGTLTVKLSGSLLDRNSVSVSSGGFFRSVDNIIVWDGNSTSALASIDPGGRGSVSFSLPIMEGASDLVTRFSNPTVTVETTIQGSQTNGTSGVETTTSTITRNIKIKSDLRLASRLVHSVGPFANSGPIPPRAEAETTYTAIWTITNSWNDVSGVVVRATLPPYVEWLGQISPSSEDVSYDGLNREVSWRPGSIPHATGFSNSPREVAFQISFLPSVSQIGSAPTIINAGSISGRDNFTAASVGEESSALTTRISTDPSYDFGEEKVTQ